MVLLMFCREWCRRQNNCPCKCLHIDWHGTHTNSTIVFIIIIINMNGIIMKFIRSSVDNIFMFYLTPLRIHNLSLNTCHRPLSSIFPRTTSNAKQQENKPTQIRKNRRKKGRNTEKNQIRKRTLWRSPSTVCHVTASNKHQTQFTLTARFVSFE